MNDSAFVKGIAKAQQGLASFGRGATLAGAAVSGAGAAILAPLGAMAVQFAAAGDAAGKASARIGISAETLQELKFAAEQSGGGVEDVEKAFGGLSKTVLNASRGSKNAVESLQDIGLAVSDLKGLDPEAQFLKTAEALSKVEDASKQGALAQQLFGRSGRQLLPMLQGGAAGIAALRKEARDLRIPLTNEEVKDAEALTDAINRLKQSATTAKNTIGAALARPLTVTLTAMAKVVATSIDWIRENKALFAGIAAGGAALVGIGAAITGLGIAATIGSAALGGVLAIISAIGAAAAFVASPIGLATAALVAGGAAWLKWTDAGKNFADFARQGFARAMEIGKEMIGGISDALAGGDLALAAKIGFAGLKLAIAEGFNAITNLIGGTAGDTLSATFKQLLDGDFAGAFKTAIDGMKAVFLNWASGVIATMTNVAKKIGEIWRGASEGIANTLNENASKGGLFGEVFGTLTGFDYSAEAERTKQLDAARDAMRKKLGITDAASDTSDAAFIGGIYDELQGNFEGMLDGWAGLAQDAADQATEDLKTKVREIGQVDTSDLAAQLAELRAQAAAVADAAKKEAAARIEGEGADVGVPDGKGAGIFGTFSSAALAALAGGISGPQDRILKANEATVEQLKAIKETEGKMLDALRDFGVTFR